MTPVPDQSTSDEAAAEAARAWILRLASGEMTAEELAAFKGWLGRDRRHQAAFEKERRLWQDAAMLKAAFAPKRREGARFRAARRWQLPLVGALAACLLLFVLLGGGGRPPADYLTGPGERLSVALPDGSTAHLNTRSAIALQYSAGQRRIELLEGEALFEVRPDPTRPFQVVALDGMAEAVGTAFLVKRQDGRVTVTIAAGKVAVVSPLPAEGMPPADGLVLAKGQQASYRRDRAPDGPRSADPLAATGWREGKIVIEGQPFAEAIEELARYRPGRVLILTDLPDAKPVSGTFAIDQIDAAIAAIATLQGLTAIEITDHLVILR